MEPRFEVFGVSQGAQLAPGRDQRGLDGVLCQIGISQDPKRDGHAAVANHARQRVERFRVPSLGLVDQRYLHPPSLGRDVDPQWVD
jgi:hypothetical protein